jgi:hypothetical protein
MNQPWNLPTSCIGKQAFPNANAAKRALKSMSKRHSGKRLRCLRCYTCHDCGQVHLGDPRADR